MTDQKETNDYVGGAYVLTHEGSMTRDRDTSCSSNWKPEPGLGLGWPLFLLLLVFVVGAIYF